MRRLVPLLAISLLLAACGAKALRPVAVDTKNDACAFCRMAVSEPRFASQLLAPGEEPRLFDDLGCLRDFLKGNPMPSGAALFVADHRTSVFVPADTALYTRVPALSTPMGSHLIAHGDPASRAADGDAAGGTPVERREILGR